MKIENLANAFVKVTNSKGHIVCDPWITDGIYEGTWHIYPRIRGHEEVLRTAAAALITHIHADHFDPHALALLPVSALIYVPDVYPNRQVTARKLNKQMLERIVFVPLSSPTHVSNFIIEFIPPMNRYGHVIERYEEEDREIAAIDTGIIIKDDVAKVTLLADNFPFNPASAGASLETMIDSDVLFFPYNTCADDYPVCHDNLSLDEKRVKALRRNTTRMSKLHEFIKLINPRATVPYSSDFVLAGPRAIEFEQVHPDVFLNKKLVARHVEGTSMIPCHHLFEDDELTITPDDISVVRLTHPTIDFESIAQELSVLKIDSQKHESVSDERLDELFKLASRNMLDRMKLKSNWRLEIQNSDTDRTWGIDLSTGKMYDGPGDQNMTVRCRTTSGYLHALMTFASHWDNAMIAYNLSWHRQPDEYDAGLYKALNHFHVPLKKS